jgi:hypothetical protein
LPAPGSAFRILSTPEDLPSGSPLVRVPRRAGPSPGALLPMNRSHPLPGRVATLLVALLVVAQSSVGRETAATSPGQPLEIGTRWELFVDRFLVASARGAALRLHEPRKAEVVLVLDAPWEGPTSAYFSVLRDGDVIRLYYRGSVAGSDHSDRSGDLRGREPRRHPLHPAPARAGRGQRLEGQQRGVARRRVAQLRALPRSQSATRPGGTLQGARGREAARAQLAAGATPGGLYAFASADGVHWRKLRTEPVMTQGAFDSLNLAFWDSARNRYACYSRIFAEQGARRAERALGRLPHVGRPARSTATRPACPSSTSTPAPRCPVPRRGAPAARVSETLRARPQKESPRTRRPARPMRCS